MQENKGYFVAEGLLYDYEFETLEIDTTSFRDEIELLKVADKCLRLATDAIQMSQKTNNYFTGNCKFYTNLIKVIRKDIKERL